MLLNNIHWYKYHGTLLPKVEPHINVELTKEDKKFLLNKSKAYFIRWTNNWNKENANFWYIVKDKKEDLSLYKSKIRNQIKKGLKNCIIKKVTKEIIANDAYYVYCQAHLSYNLNIDNITEDKFYKNIMSSEYDYFAVYKNDSKTMIAYAANRISNNMCSYIVMNFDPNYLNLYPSYALIYNMNKYYLNELELSYVSDGARSLSHDSNIQNFLIQKFNFRKLYCDLNIEYRKDIKIFVKILFPFRKYFEESNINFFKKIDVLLKHEQLRR